LPNILRLKFYTKATSKVAFPESIIGLFVKVSLVLLEVLLPLVLIYFLNGYGKIFFVHFESLGGTIAYILRKFSLEFLASARIHGYIDMGHG